MKAPFALLFAVVASPVLADSLALDVNNDAVKLNYANELNKNYEADFAWTHVKDKGNNLSAGFSLKQDINSLLVANIGGKAIFQHNQHLPDGSVLAVGGRLTFTPYALRQLKLSAEAYFAPNVLSFGDIENYRETELRAAYQFSDQLTGFVGYRNYQADYKDNGYKLNDVRLYDSGMIGAEFHF